jgi:hypothetical protein
MERTLRVLVVVPNPLSMAMPPDVSKVRSYVGLRGEEGLVDDGIGDVVLLEYLIGLPP